MKTSPVILWTVLFATLAGAAANAAAPQQLPRLPRLPEQQDLQPPPPLPGGPAQPDEAYGSVTGSRFYRHCLELVNRDADGAYDQAMLWRDQGGGAAAEHCAAMALARLGHLEDAAQRLHRIAAEQAQAGAALRAELFGQSGLLWLMAGKPESAHESFSQALAVAPEEDPARAQYHFDRAQAAANLGWWRNAADDLTRTLALGRGRVDAFVLRARAHRALGDLASAWNDVEAALALDPDNATAMLERGHVRQDRGDLDGARADWLRVKARDDAPDLQAEAGRQLAELDARMLRECAPEKDAPGSAGVRLRVVDCPR